MSQSMSLQKLDEILSGARKAVDEVARELKEIQFRFVSTHQAAKARHDATLNDLSLRAAYDLGVLPAEVRRAIDERLAVEHETLEQRRQELSSHVVPKADKIADDLLVRAQQSTQRMRVLNPGLDEREEKLKAERAEMEAELERLNAEVRRLSGCLTLFIHFFKIGELDRQRQRLLGRMQENARALRDVRQEWDKARSNYAADQEQLRQEWQQASVDAARAREELAHLSDDDERERLALQRAVFYVFDHWKTPLPAGGPLVDEINQMVQLNIQTDAYEEGLGKVAGLIALLGGISQGLQSLNQSVQALISEQKMHSAHLGSISVSVDDSVLHFHKQWGELRRKVQDEKALGDQPAQFSAVFDAEVRGWLSEKNIARMFESLGGALTAATRGWKG